MDAFDDITMVLAVVETATRLMRGCKVLMAACHRDRVATSSDKKREKVEMPRMPLECCVGIYLSKHYLEALNDWSGKILNLSMTNGTGLQQVTGPTGGQGQHTWRCYTVNFSPMSDDVWDRCPDNTNIVEPKNQYWKQSVALPIHQAFINLYKLDRTYCTKQLLARRKGI